MSFIVCVLLIVHFTSVSAVASSFTGFQLLTGLRDRASESLYPDISYGRYPLLHINSQRGQDCIHLPFGCPSAMNGDSSFAMNTKVLSVRWSVGSAGPASMLCPFPG